MSDLLNRINSLSPEKRQQLLEKIKNKQAKQPVSNIVPLLRGEGVQSFPLSFSQERLWFMYQWEPESPSYNVACVFNISMELHIDHLHQAINKLVERHEILRTTYKVVGEDTVQVIHPYDSISLEILNLEHLPQGDRERQKDEWIKEKSVIPFKLENEWPIKAYLISLNPNEHYLLLNIHHIACDGWSLGIIMDEIQQVYLALSRNQEITMSPMKAQYADFASWQREYLTGEVLDYHQNYWLSKFQGEIPVLELPTDKPRPPVKTSNGSSVIKPLPEGLYQRFESWCREEDVTFYMMSLAAYAILLYRYTGQSDIVIGSPVANRSREEIESNVGFFVNTLPIRIQLDENATFRDTVRQIKQISLEAQEHQDFPLDQLIKLLPIERDLSHTPLFQVMYVVQNIQVGRDVGEEFPIHFSGSTNTNSSKFDLTLSANAYNVQAEYSTDLFYESTIERMIEHYCTLLDQACIDADCSIADMDMLSEAEKNQLLIEWNDNEVQYDPDFQIVQQIQTYVDKQPNAVALINEGISYTYFEMNQRANRLANDLRSRGISSGHTVAIFLERSAEFVIAMLAVLKSGGAYVPLDPSYPKERLEYMVRQSSATVVITQSKLSADIQPEGVTMLELDHPSVKASLEQMDASNPPIHSASDDLMYIVFTSGTTGTPKGVSVEHRQFSNYIQGLIRHLHIDTPLTYAMASTLAADLGTTNVFGALCTGGTLHVLSYDLSCDPDGVAEYFKVHPIDIMKVVPSHFEVLMEAEEPAHVIPHKVLILAGEALSWETVRKIRELRPDVDIQNHYGPTETTVSAFAYPIPTEIEEPRLNIVPIGYPFGNVKRYVVDSRLHPVPVGTPGELYIGGPGVARGYFGSEEMTASRFVPNPFVSTTDSRMYRTGDRVRYMPDGAVEILGRMDRQIKIRGFRIELGEIESVITSYPFVADAVVLVKELSSSDKKIVCYVVFNSDSSEEEDTRLADLKKKIKDKLPEYMVPSHMIQMDALPLNPNGKVDVNYLASLELAVHVSDPNAAKPQTATEQHIWEVWKDILGTDAIGIDDSFFELGGESFKALKVVRRLGDWISIMDFFKNPTIRSLAAYIDQGEQSERHFLHKLTRHPGGQAEKVSLVCVPYAGGSAITFQPLAAEMPPHIDLYAMDLPGHDYSRKEEELLSLEEVARLCVEEIKENVKGPVALYGHCVGGALTIEIARQLEEENVPLLRVFLGGTFPIARIPGRFFDLYSKLFPSDRSMSNKSYHAFLKALGGFTEVDDQDERDFMIRCLRHDARQSEDYYTEAYANKQFSKLSCPITCVIGEKDRATELYEERYKEWDYFSDQVDMVVIPHSGHYFIKHQADQLSQWISDLVEPEHDVEVTASTYQRNAELEKSSQKKALYPTLKMFFIVVFGQLMSVLGSGLTGIAIGVWVYSQNGSVADFAVISSASLIPGILVLPIAGAIVDRYDRRLVMLFSDIMMAVPIAVLAVLMATGSLEIWHIYVTSAVGSMARSFHRPAFIAAIAQIIPKQYLGHANGIIHLATSSSEMISPLIGVALYSLIGMANIFILDFVSFTIAIVTLALVRFPNMLFRRREETFVREVLMGWKFIVKRPGMMYMIAFFFVGNVLFGLATVLIQPLVLSFGTPKDLATITTLGAIGAMSGGLLMSIWGGTKRMATGMVGFVILEGLFMIVSGLRPNVLLTAIGIFGVWFSVTLVNTHWQSLIQSKVGLELQGRVLATNQMIAMSSMPLGYLIAGSLADSVFGAAMNEGGALANTLGPFIGVGPGRGIGLLIICVGVLVMVWSTIGFNFKPLRNMEDDMEDAIPDAIIEDRDTLQEKLDSQQIGKSIVTAYSGSGGVK